MHKISKNIFLTTLILSAFTPIFSQKIVPHKYKGNESFSYEETIQIYKKMDALHADASLVECGLTDAGEPLHLFIVNTDEEFTPELIKNSDKSIVLIMNGIHPGEPDGIDASMVWLDDLLNRKSLNHILDNTILLVIPVYNIDGMLMRGCCTRANQNGPTEYGFRGNAQNLDLNRDFLKQESLNSISFAEIVRKYDPDVFIDTHVSNGADYPYTFSLIHSSGSRLPSPLNTFYEDEMVPYIYKNMKEKKWDVIPYVNIHNTPPDNGFSAFYDSPRYSNGFTSLFGIFSFTAETHMLKPFPKRVEATIDFFETILEYTNKNSRKIQLYRNFFKDNLQNNPKMTLRYEVDKDSLIMLDFKTYAYRYEKSKLTGSKQLYYDSNVIIEKKIPYNNTFKATYTADIPKFFVIPFAYNSIKNKLEAAGVKTQKINTDTLMELESWYIPNVEFKGMYEGRPMYAKKDTNVLKVDSKVHIPKGSHIVKMGSSNDPFIMNTLHPLADDSYLNWGYFASAFEQKEYFSSYVFDGFATKLLEENPELKKEFNAKKESDKAFAEDSYAQLNFIYKRSNFAEKTLNLYPIYFKF